MALPIDVFRNVAKTIPKVAQTVTNTPAQTPAPNSVTQGANGFSWVDPTTGKTITVNPANKGGFMTAFGTYAQRRQGDLAEYEKGINEDLAYNNNATNANFDSSQRQAYVDYMRKQRALPSQLQALGVRGGATESGLLNLYNNYGVEHAAAEQQRAAELASNQRDRDAAWREYYQQYKTDLADREQTAINNQINEYKNDLTIFQNSVARYPTTEKGYNQYKDLIKSLKNGNDPLKDYKVALVQQQMASQFPNGLDGIKKSGSGSSGGGGGGSRRRGGSRSSGGGGGGNGNSSSPSSNVSAANTKGQSMTDYYKKAAKKSSSKKKAPTYYTGSMK